MYNKAQFEFSKRSVSELEFERLLRRAEEKSKLARPTLLRKLPIVKRAANS